MFYLCWHIWSCNIPRCKEETKKLKNMMFCLCLWLSILFILNTRLLNLSHSFIWHIVWEQLLHFKVYGKLHPVISSLNFGFTSLQRVKAFNVNLMTVTRDLATQDNWSYCAVLMFPVCNIHHDTGLGDSCIKMLPISFTLTFNNVHDTNLLLLLAFRS